MSCLPPHQYAPLIRLTFFRLTSLEGLSASFLESRDGMIQLLLLTNT